MTINEKNMYESYRFYIKNKLNGSKGGGHPHAYATVKSSMQSLSVRSDPLFPAAKTHTSYPTRHTFSTERLKLRASIYAFHIPLIFQIATEKPASDYC